MNRKANRQAICDVLMEQAKTDRDLIVLCSDSRGSASLSEFAHTFPEQFVEVGIAEQSLVSVAAGLARCGKKPFAASPACFLSTRSLEQIKVDVAYSATNVKLIGISGGISYGALGMTHHSAQDIAAISAIPGMRVYLPSDRIQTQCLMGALLKDRKPAYIRIGRNPVEDIYQTEAAFQMDKACKLAEGNDIALIACGEMVKPAVDAAAELRRRGIAVSVLDMYCVKPIDREAVIETARSVNAVITIEEHSRYGGLGAAVSQIVSENCPKRVINLALPDEPVIAGKSQEVFDHYHLNTEGIVNKAMELMQG